MPGKRRRNRGRGAIGPRLAAGSEREQTANESKAPDQQVHHWPQKNEFFSPMQHEGEEEASAVSDQMQTLASGGKPLKFTAE